MPQNPILGSDWFDIEHGNNAVKSHIDARYIWLIGGLILIPLACGVVLFTRRRQ